MKFEILNRWTRAVKFTAEINCAEGTSHSIKLGLAVKCAIETRADLTDADLTRADLTDANLTDADLTGADLTDADLTDADLTGACLRSVRADFFDVLLRARPEIPDLLAALRAGRINGSSYTGECACLAGTIAKSRNVYYEALDFVDSGRPAERWFLGIRGGDTPENSIIAKITEGWIEEFLSFAPTAEVARTER